LSRGWLSIVTMVTCRQCRERRISMYLAPARYKLAVHETRGPVDCNRPFAIVLRYRRRERSVYGEERE
jgi:hypothetical protein